jgi:hypothetical protein
MITIPWFRFTGLLPFSSEDMVVKILGLFLSFLLVLQVTCFPQIASAAGVTYTSTGGGGVQAQIPVNKIGALLLVDAVAFLNNDVIEVKGQVKGHEGQNQTLLTGTIMNTSISGSGGSRTIHGKVSFSGGASISSLKVTTYDFDLPLSGCAGTSTVSGECSHMTFTQCHEPVASKPTKTTKISSTAEHHLGKKIIVCVALAAIVATAIAVPVAVCCACHGHHHGNNNNGIALAQAIWANQHKPQPIISTPTPSQHWP